MGAAAVAPLLLLDGWRSEEAVEHKLAEEGARLPPGELGPLLRKLLLAGVLVETETQWNTLEWSPWPAHRCHGCGASCQGHWIGPLSRSFVEKTQGRLEELRAKYPQLRGQKPFVRLDPDDPALYLNASSGQCLFLGENLRCILHAEYGLEEKPAICQMFPVVRGEDHTDTRIGIGLTCLKQAEQVLDREPNAPSEYWQDLHAALDGHLFHTYPREIVDGEGARLTATVRESDNALQAVLRELDMRQQKIDAESAPVQLEQLARKHLARVEEALAAEPVIEAMCQRTGLLPDWVNAIRALARDDADRTSTESLSAPLDVDPQSDRMRVIRDALERFFFLRLYRHFPAASYSMAAFCLGLWVATALTEPRGGDDRQFGQVLAVWMRMLHTPALQTGLFANFDEVDAFLSSFRAALC